MARLVDAWDKTTGERLKYLVPEHFIGHKILGPNLVSKPPKKMAATPAGKEKES